jgi:hypothetical protein
MKTLKLNKLFWTWIKKIRLLNKYYFILIKIQGKSIVELSYNWNATKIYIIRYGVKINSKHVFRNKRTIIKYIQLL